MAARRHPVQEGQDAERVRRCVIGLDMRHYGKRGTSIARRPP
jgi:hypothetical protein